MRVWTAVPFTWIHIAAVLPVCANKDVQRREVNEAGVRDVMILEEEFSPESDDASSSAHMTAHSHLDLQMRAQNAKNKNTKYGYTWKVPANEEYHENTASVKHDQNKYTDADPDSLHKVHEAHLRPKRDWVVAEVEVLPEPDTNDSPDKDGKTPGHSFFATGPELRMVKVTSCAACDGENAITLGAILLVQRTSLVKLQLKGEGHSDDDNKKYYLMNVRGIMAEMDVQSSTDAEY